MKRIEINKKKMFWLLAGLILFHLCISSLFYFISVKGYFPSLHNGKGIWNYALDSNGYHKEALKGYDFLKNGMWRKWWDYKYHSWWHARWIALMYLIFKPLPLAMAPLNAFLWAFNFLLVFSISASLLNDQRNALIAGFIFSFFPSNIMNSIQLLKGQFYIFDVLLFLWGWIWLWKEMGEQKKKFVKVLPAIMSVGAGYYMMVEIRFYLLMIWTAMALLFYLFSMVSQPRRWVVSTMMIFVVLLIFFIVKPVKPVKPVKQYPWQFSHWVPDSVEYQLISLARARERFCTCCPHAGANIDTQVRFHSARDVIRYLPRALELGWLAPFPNFWFKRAKTSGRVSRIIVGMEMIALYFFFLGIAFWVFIRGLFWEFVVIFSCTFLFVLLISLAIVNLGTLYRWRHIYFLPVFIYGVGGWMDFLDKRNVLFV